MSNPWFALIIAMAGGLLTAMALYYRKRSRPFSAPVTLTLFVLRFLSTTLLLLLLFGPVFTRMVKKIEKPVLVLLADNSRSMLMNGDSSLTRQLLNENWQKLAKNWQEEFDVHPFIFDENLRRADQCDFTGEDTDISSALEEIFMRFANRNPAAIILASDGIHTKGRDPQLTAAQLPVPVYTIKFGDPAIRKDVRIAQIRYNEVVYSGNEFPVEIQIEAEKVQGENLQLRLNDPEGNLHTANFRVESERQTFTHTFWLRAGNAGMKRLNAEVLPAEGEQNILNNRRSLTIEIIDSRRKILLAGAFPHPDIGAIRQALLGNEQLEVIVQTDREDMLPVPAAELSLAVLFQLPGRQNQFKNSLGQLEQAGIPLWFVLGGTSELNAFNNLNTGFRIERPIGKTDEIQGSLNNQFTAFTVPEALAGAIPRFPPIHMPFGEYKTAVNTQSLIYRMAGGAPTTIPVWLFNETPGKRISVLAAEGIWRWRMAAYERFGTHENFDALIRGTVNYLAMREDKSLFRIHAENRYREGRPVIFLAELYNEALEPVNGPEVRMQIKNAENQKFSFVFSRMDSGYRLDAGRFSAGTYQWTADVQFGSKTWTKSGSFTVEAIENEGLSLQARHDVLDQLALATSGRSIPASELDNLPNMLNARDDFSSVLRSHLDIRELIDWKLLMGLLFLLLAFEWGLRKYHGHT